MMKKNAPVGVYLTRFEKEKIKDLADQAGIPLHAFLQYAVRYFVREYQKNPRILKKKKTEILDFPD